MLSLASPISTARAHQSPAGCTGSGLHVEFSPTSGLATIHRNGDHLEIGARVSNLGANPCDLSGLSVKVTLPTPAGADNGRTVVLASEMSLRAGTAATTLPLTAPYDIDLDEGVFQAPVKLTYEATVHSDASDPSTGQGSLTSPLGISRPRTELTVKPDYVAGKPPLTVTYTYELTNTSPVLPDPMLPSPKLISGKADDKAVVKDGNCSPVTYVAGDDGLSTPASLDPLIAGNPLTPETWTFTCTKTFDAPGIYSSSAEVTGISARDGNAWPASPATADVTVYGSDLVVEKSHEGDFLAGGTGRYQLLVTNNGNESTDGTVTVADLLPAGLTATAMTGPGWDCGLVALSCTRNDPLASGSSYPPVYVTVAVADSPPDGLINTAEVSGGGEPGGAKGNNTASDPTEIRVPGKPTPPASTKRFRVRSVKARGNGSVAIKLTAPSAGTVTIDDAGKKNLVTRAKRRLRARGTYVVIVKSNRRLRRKLARGHRPVKVTLKVKFRTSHGATARRVKARFRLG
ncbi:MAG: hypothetical protein J0H98_09140 [Solirubrobacterales bacterium]|nr:hypothetical protein [Solirubrobacterales bacterium]